MVNETDLIYKNRSRRRRVPPPPKKKFSKYLLGIRNFDSGKLNAIVEYKVSKLRFENDSKEPKKKV